MASPARRSPAGVQWPSMRRCGGRAGHQDYFARNPTQGYCRVIIAPKVTKFRQKYADRLK